MRRALKLLALLAVLMMPFGMAPATAAPHRQLTTGMLMQHCPDQGAKHDMKGGFSECTMACAAALPAADLAREGPLPIPTVPDASTVQQVLNGLHPDIATPPPKTS
jgi:hypothetical protein